MRVSLEENTSDICTKIVDVATFKYHEVEINNGFPRLRQKVFGADSLYEIENQRFLGGMLSEKVISKISGTEDDIKSKTNGG